jgi:hypothetical protein
MTDSVLTHSFTSKDFIMATKKKAANSANGTAKLVFPVPIVQQNADKPASQRKKDAQKEFENKVFPTLRNSGLWRITSFKWKGPVKPKMNKYILTVGLKKKSNAPSPSGDSTVPQPNTPPPSA